MDSANDKRPDRRMAKSARSEHGARTEDGAQIAVKNAQAVRVAPFHDAYAKLLVIVSLGRCARVIGLSS
jgi:hypothetical protein